MTDSELINCGMCKVQQQYRVAIRNTCNCYAINEGDFVEVYIRRIEQ